MVRLFIKKVIVSNVKNIYSTVKYVLNSIKHIKHYTKFYIFLILKIS